jgi:glutaminyl-tRNA synthetase
LYHQSVDYKNLELLAKMKEGKFSEGECVLRAKIDMASPFMCLRDPALYRIRFEKHHQNSMAYL